MRSKNKYDEEYDKYVLYMHLIFAQIENIKDLKEFTFNEFEYPPISKIHHNSNIMNAHCIMKRISDIKDE